MVLKAINKLLNLYIYSGIHIGLCVLAMIGFSDLLFGSEMFSIWYYITCLIATVFIYSLHKIIGASQLSAETNSKRIRLFKKLTLPLIIYTGALFFILLYAIWSLESEYVKALIFPGILSALYVLPLNQKGTRLRDIQYLKIFIIALVWTLVSVTVPLYIESEVNTTGIFLLSFEKAFFMLAITFPFDYRDRKIDAITGLKTLSAALGKKKVAILSSSLIAMASMLVISMDALGTIGLNFVMAFLISYLLTLFLLHWVLSKQDDLYYSGILDGTMLFPWMFLQLILLILQQ